MSFTITARTIHLPTHLQCSFENRYFLHLQEQLHTFTFIKTLTIHNHKDSFDTFTRTDTYIYHKSFDTFTRTASIHSREQLHIFKTKELNIYQNRNDTQRQLHIFTRTASIHSREQLHTFTFTKALTIHKESLLDTFTTEQLRFFSETS